MPTRVLVTSFGPFGDTAVNPSSVAVEKLAAGWDGATELLTAQLPVSFARSARELDQLLQDFRPQLVIATGLAAGRKTLTVERLAVNLADARISDIDGHQPAGVELVPGAPAARWSNLPVKRIVKEVGDRGIPAAASMSAGSYVCNSVFHQLCCWADASGERAGFIHVPDSAVLAPTAAARALKIAIETSLRYDEDIDAAIGDVA